MTDLTNLARTFFEQERDLNKTRYAIIAALTGTNTPHPDLVKINWQAIRQMGNEATTWNPQD